MKNTVLQSLKKIDYKLFGTLLVLGLLPTIYTTVRIFFLGSMPGDWGYNIASQLAWVNVVYEVIQEALILPMFYFLGKSLADKDEFANKVRTGLILTAGIYVVMSIVMILFIRPMLILMSQQEDLIKATSTYIRLESIGLIFSTSVKFLMLVLITMKKESYLFLILGVQMVLSVLLDTFLVSSLPVSLQFGVNGIAITNIIVSLVLLIVMILVLDREYLRILDLGKKMDFSWLKSWLKIGGMSGIESFVRNAAFIIMILRLVNVVAEQGSFWVTNNFIWGWLLLPVLQLGELIKRDSAVPASRYQEKVKGYFALTGIVIVIWFVTIPGWGSFINKVMGVGNYQTIVHLSLISLGFYIVFALNNVVDSIFYGRGRTDLMLYQSLIVNTVFYGAAFILYRMGIFVPTLTGIAVMFGTGMVFDSIITFVMFGFFMKKENAVQ